MKKHTKRLAALVLAAILTVGILPAGAAQTDVLTPNDAAKRLMDVGFKYTPGLTLSDILEGIPSEGLDSPITRAQAMVMLERAFGGLPAPVGDSARAAYPAERFANVPDGASEELTHVLAAGIVTGDGNGLLSPDQPITKEELDALIRRAYALKGTDLRDDFYAAANKQWLDSSDIPAGLSLNGPFYGLGLTVSHQVAQLIRDIHAQPQQ